MKLLLVFLLIVPDYLAQQWSIGAGYGTDYCDREIYFKTILEESAYHLNHRDFPEWGFTSGLSAIYHSSGNYELESGLRFSQKAIRHRTKENSFPPMLTHTDYDMKGYYLDVPLKINLVYGNKFQFIASAGITTSFAIQRSSVATTYSYETALATTKSNYTLLATAFFTPEFAMGATWHFSGKWSLRVLPVVRFSFPAGIPGSYRFHIWSVGVGATICYRLN